MNDQVNALYEKLKTNSHLEKSAQELVLGIADLFDALTNDPAGVKTLVAELRGCAKELGDAVLHNTHPHPTPATPPVTPPSPPAPVPATEPVQAEYEPVPVTDPDPRHKHGGHRKS